MADIEDVNEGVEVGEIEAVEQKIAAEPPKQAEPDLPEKYRGKSVAEVVKMHQEAEKLVGRMANETHEVRKLADELLKSQIQAKPPVEEVKPVDFFENPQEAIRQQIENNPRVLAAEQYARQVQAQQTSQQLSQIHPDVHQIVQSEDFRNWVGASKVRQKLFQQADAYDLDAANELLSTYKELRSVRSQREAQAESAARESTLKQVAVDTGGSGESTKKIYRRADLIRLKMRDPGKYASMQDDIMQAYSEGRVK